VQKKLGDKLTHTQLTVMIIIIRARTRRHNIDHNNKRSPRKRMESEKSALKGNKNATRKKKVK
jgi:hypothetical protein